MLFVHLQSSPHGMDGPVGLHRRLNCRTGAHQHGAVDVGRHHQDAQQDGPDDGALKTQIVGAAGHRQAGQVRVSAPERRNRDKQSKERSPSVIHMSFKSTFGVRYPPYTRRNQY